MGQALFCVCDDKLKKNEKRSNETHRAQVLMTRR